MIWRYWLAGLTALFVTIALFYLFTPTYDIISDQFASSFNTSTSTSSSFQNQIAQNYKMWNLWPIVAGIMVFALVLIGTSEEESEYRGGLI